MKTIILFIALWFFGIIILGTFADYLCPIIISHFDRFHGIIDFILKLICFSGGYFWVMFVLDKYHEVVKNK